MCLTECNHVCECTVCVFLPKHVHVFVYVCARAACTHKRVCFDLSLVTVEGPCRCYKQTRLSMEDMKAYKRPAGRHEKQPR